MKKLFTTCFIIFAFIGGCFYGHHTYLSGTKTNRVRSRAETVQQRNETLEELALRPEFNPSTEDIILEIVKVFSPSGKPAVNWAIKCSFSESKWRPFVVNDKNKNGTKDYSVFQVNEVHLARFGNKYQFNWRENIRVAYELYKRKTVWYGSQCQY